MRVGTKSILFGAHQFIWHPTTVFFAWKELYGKWPNFKEAVCIVVHDWGYWGCSNMDGPEGEMHPIYGALIASIICDKNNHNYLDMVLYHSRHFADKVGAWPSKLCWADKLCVKFDPWWFYLPRTILTGEIKEYRERAADFGAVPLSASHREWYKWAQPRMMAKAYNRDTRPPYKEGS